MTALRPIDIGDRPREVLRDQAAPVLDWVNIERLRIDDTYQRPLGVKNWSAISAIAKAFDWTKFGPILCAPLPGNLLAVIDGQHRAHAAALVGIELVPAMIVPMTPAQQASAFAGVNGTQIRISPHHVYKAALAAGEGWAERCLDVVEASGCKLPAYNPSSKLRKAGQVYCVNTVRELVVRAGLAAELTAALRALVDATGAQPQELEADVLKPWVQAIAQKRAAALPLDDFLRAHPLLDMIGRADKLHARPEFAGTTRFDLRRKGIAAQLGGWIEAGVKAA